MWRKWREHYRVTPLVGLIKVVEDLFQVHFLYLGSCRLRVYPTDLQELPHQALQALHVPDHQLHRPTIRRSLAERKPHWTPPSAGRWSWWSGTWSAWRAWWGSSWRSVG